MKLFTIRPYHGHDCNSWDGFNNGHYLASIEVNAVDEQSAIDKAMDLFATEHSEMSKWERDSWFGENTFYHEYAHTDSNGNEIDPETFEGDESNYLYQYVSFEIDMVQEIETR